MNALPKIIIRIDDGEEFVLNENGTYTNRCMLKFKEKGHLVNEYSYDILMVNNKGLFKVADGTEDIEAMRQNWLKQCESKNDGHGDED